MKEEEEGGEENVLAYPSNSLSCFQELWKLCAGVKQKWKKKRKKSDISPRSRYFPTIRDRRGIAGISVSGTRSHYGGFLTRRGRKKKKKESKKKKKRKKSSRASLSLLANERTTQVFRPTGNWNPTNPCSQPSSFLPYFFFLSFFLFFRHLHRITYQPSPPIY